MEFWSFYQKGANFKNWSLRFVYKRRHCYWSIQLFKLRNNKSNMNQSSFNWFEEPSRAKSEFNSTINSQGWKFHSFLSKLKRFDYPWQVLSEVLWYRRDLATRSAVGETKSRCLRHLSVDVDYRPIYSSDGIALKRLGIQLSNIYWVSQRRLQCDHKYQSYR